MKAFKMACLQYKPSPVTFEESNYQRKELIEAKNVLLKYCLSQLKHLDLGVIDDQDITVKYKLNKAWKSLVEKDKDGEGETYGKMDPTHIPPWKASHESQTGSDHGKPQLDWLN